MARASTVGVLMSDNPVECPCYCQSLTLQSVHGHTTPDGASHEQFREAVAACISTVRLHPMVLLEVSTRLLCLYSLRPPFRGLSKTRAELGMKCSSRVHHTDLGTSAPIGRHAGEMAASQRPRRFCLASLRFCSASLCASAPHM